jgi:hypothetical protein
MRFFYENGYGDTGYFSEKDIIKAVYTAWNIDADLWLLNDGLRKLDPYKFTSEQAKIVFASPEGYLFNSDVLKEFGYYMNEDNEIRKISTDEVVKYGWSEVKQLI